MTLNDTIDDLISREISRRLAQQWMNQVDLEPAPWAPCPSNSLSRSEADTMGTAERLSDVNATDIRPSRRKNLKIFSSRFSCLHFRMIDASSFDKCSLMYRRKSAPAASKASPIRKSLVLIIKMHQKYNELSNNLIKIFYWIKYSLTKRWFFNFSYSQFLYFIPL